MSRIVGEEFGWAAPASPSPSPCARSPSPSRWAAATGSWEIINPSSDRQSKYIGCWAITEPGHGSDALMPGEIPHRRERSSGADRTADSDDYV
jgi:alkylation response protein AidB-like acyl-CoA dehydrogenase